jgi:alpha-ketoglutarate-dependent taurine dioxygenase
MPALDGVTITRLHQDNGFYLLLAAEDGATALADWAGRHGAALDALLLEHKAVLFRNFNQASKEAFADFANAVATPLDYVYRSTPRSQVGSRMYTATEFPRAYTIPVHCENAYQSSWPMRLFFYCRQPAMIGGQTPLADVAAATAAIDAGVRELFARKGVMYVRNYGSGIDLPWQEVFQTSAPAQVEAFCRQHDIAYEWGAGGRLQTRQVRPALMRHPVSGVELWFNQAHLFHVSSLEPATLAAMQGVFDPDQLPRNACFGDGTPLEVDMLDHIREAYARNTVAFPWRANDILMVDNMQVAHGRRPFVGAREVLVMMGNACNGL